MGVTLFDAGALIGFLDSADTHHQKSRNAFESAQERGDRLSIPASALAEALVNPARQGSPATEQVLAFVAALPLDVAPLDVETAITAADLRARHGPRLKLPDALVVATSMTLGADVLVTTDRGWPTRRALKLQSQLIVL